MNPEMKKPRRLNGAFSPAEASMIVLGLEARHECE